jgi:malate dehydrogenase (quinone)
MPIGTDVNFGSLTRSMIAHLIKSGAVSLFTRHEVRDLVKHTGEWKIDITDLAAKTSSQVNTKFVFIGAGG